MELVTNKYIEKIEKIRVEKKVSVKDLAKSADIAPSYYSRMKSGDIKGISIEKIEALAAALGYTLEMIKDGKKEGGK